MLPNREKDKRRILSEGWYRTQWGGYSPGGKWLFCFMPP